MKQIQTVAIVLAIVAGAWGYHYFTQTLDFRNAEISNGLLYAGGSNSPYSGKVTHIPLMSLPREGLAFPYVNEYFSLENMPAGAVYALQRCDVRFSDGLPNGKAVCSMEGSHQKSIEIGYTHGQIDGEATIFQDKGDGKPLVTAHFSKGVQDGDYRIFSMLTGKLAYRGTFTAGLQTGEEESYYLDTGELALRGGILMGKRSGERISYYKNGKQQAISNFEDGALHGKYEKYDAATGNVIERGQYVQGYLDGEVITFNAQGKKIKLQIYRGGVQQITPVEFDPETGNPIGGDNTGSTDAASASGQTAGDQACLDKWIAAHRKAVGEDAVITADQLGEWEGWCRAGKQP
ncbi:toxin-antitoxin system YwqK family antitoxin [Chitinimonas naiadis]